MITQRAKVRETFRESSFSLRQKNTQTGKVLWNTFISKANLKLRSLGAGVGLMPAEMPQLTLGLFLFHPVYPISLVLQQKHKEIAHVQSRAAASHRFNF